MSPLHMRFVYLLYISRSGSTMLANQIARQMPEVLVLPELDFVGLLFAHGDEHVRRLSPAGLRQLISLDPKLGDTGFSDEDWQVILTYSAGKGIKPFLTAISVRYAENQGRQRPRVTLFQRGTLISVVQDIVEIDPTGPVPTCLSRSACIDQFNSRRACISVQPLRPQRHGTSGCRWAQSQLGEVYRSRKGGTPSVSRADSGNSV